MTQVEINDCFRKLIIDLAEMGYKKTNIGRILFGMSAFSQVNKFINGIDNPDEQMNFGISPLTKIGNLLNHDLHLVYLDSSDGELMELINKRNERFQAELTEDIKNYLDNNIKPKKEHVPNIEKLNRDVDEILQLLL